MSHNRVDKYCASVTLLLLAGCSSAHLATVPRIPASLRAPDTQRLLQVVRAEGAQIYQCRNTQAPAIGFNWVFTAPEATLFTASGRRFGKHYAGPTWEATDGSKVTGTLLARDPGPDPSAIPWLLLRASTGSDRGTLAHVATIQRLATAGGQAPAGGCNAATVNQSVRVPYQAQYWFYVVR